MIKKLILVICVASFFGCGGKKFERIEKAQLHFRASQELFLKNENIQALAEAKKSEELNRKDPQVQNFLGILYGQIDEFELAETHMRKAVALEPKYSEAQVNLCGFLMRKEDYTNAMTHCRKAAEDLTYPNAERAYHNLGYMYEKQSNTKDATEMYKKALLHNKNFVLSLHSLGKMYYTQKNYKEAESTLLKADEACMSSPVGAWGTSCSDAQYHLALTSFQMKKKSQAVTALKNCVETDPQGDFKKKCEKSLRLYR